MVGAKQQETRDFILVPTGAVRPAVVCSRHYIALHRSACSGAATSKAGEEARPPSPWWSDRSVFRCCGRIEERVCVVPYSMFDIRCPLRRGVHLSFIDHGEGELQACRTIRLHGEVWRAAPRSWRPP
jgi:hypothetical protein